VGVCVTETELVPVASRELQQPKAPTRSSSAPAAEPALSPRHHTRVLRQLHRSPPAAAVASRSDLVGRCRGAAWQQLCGGWRSRPSQRAGAGPSRRTGKAARLLGAAGLATGLRRRSRGAQKAFLVHLFACSPL